ncbi:MAG: HDOD domain-containing protein [Calditrichaeota bacterium]|nr:MAG: HDOD domain-containing protein [Calditrichota bacterium]MBL1206401.1 HDOD domain-containing protein [Calditrichota bacterium]NOG46227.1 HDOD domain-containing protein [Calditrichota bacterium]
MDPKELPPIEITSDELFKSHNKLPPLPQILTRIHDIMESEETNVNDISKLVSVDVSLTAQILKIVNSAYYGLRKEITDLKIAIAFLGINEIYRIVLSLSVIKSIDAGKENDIKQFWYKSYYTALCVKLLATKYARYLDRDELWSAALLHDIGSLVYLKFYPDHYQEIINIGEKKGLLFSQVEKELNIPSSSTFGSLVCTYWKLPNPIKLACENHTIDVISHISDDDSKADYKRILCVGSLCAEFSIRQLNKKVNQQLANTVMSVLNIDDHEFLLLMGEIRDLQLEVEQFMQSLF